MSFENPAAPPELRNVRLSPFPAAVRGGLGFAAVSVASFSIWAFGGGWFRGRGGEGALYAAIAAAFVGLSGLFLRTLIVGEHRLRRFYGIFAPAFAAYAVVWSLFWFWLGFGAGEWLGAFLGSLTFVAVVAARVGGWAAFGKASAVFFLLHTAGYFIGGQAMGFFLGFARASPPPVLDASGWAIVAKLSWGVFYGLGFGAGLGYVLALFQNHDAHVSPPGDAAGPENSRP